MVFASAAALYLLTAQRGVAWQDSGTFQWRMRHFDLTGHLGLALAHPLLIVLGKLAGTLLPGPMPWRFNAVSAVVGAVAAANLLVLVRRLAPKGAAAAIFAGGAFALAHTVWWLATIAESHMLLAALMSGELLAVAALLGRPQIRLVALLGLLNGLGTATHDLALLALPAYGATVVALAARRRLQWRAVAVFVLAWAAGASLLLALVIRQAGESGLTEAVRSALFGQGWERSVLVGSFRAAVHGTGYILYNFPNLTLPLAAVGLWRLRRLVGGPLAAVIGYLLGVHFLFAVRYTVADQFMFFVPLYLMVCLLAGLGLAHLCRAGGTPTGDRSPAGGARQGRLRAAALVSLALNPVLFAAAPALVRALNVRLPGSRRALPFRDGARYWLTPWKVDEDSASRFARAAVSQLEHVGREPAIIFADETTYWPLRWVIEVEHAGPKIRLVGGPDRQLLDELRADPAAFWQTARRKRSPFFATANVRGYCPAPLLPHVDAQRTGVLYRVTVPLAAPGSSTGPSPAPAPAGAAGGAAPE